MNLDEYTEVTRKRITESIGENWLRGVSHAELKNFALFSSQSVIYGYEGNEDIQGHCFRGYKRGLEFARGQGVEK